jgi:hypothetical protein
VDEFDREMLCVGTASAITEHDQTATSVKSHRHLVTGPRNLLGIIGEEASGIRSERKAFFDCGTGNSRYR